MAVPNKAALRLTEGSHDDSDIQLYSAEDCIRSLEILRNCGSLFVEELAANFKIEVFQPGKVMLLAGSSKPSLRVVLKGSVEVLSQGKVVRLLSDGDSYGEAQLLGVQRQAPHSLRAKTVVEICWLSRKALLQILARHVYERCVFDHLAVSHRLEDQRARCQRQQKAGDGAAENLKLRQLTERQAQLEQILNRGRISATDTHADSPEELHPSNIWPRSAKMTPRIRRMVVEENTMPGCHQSLADWHKQLSTSSEARRLDLWQLPYYRSASPARGSALPPCVSRASGSASRCSRPPSTQPPRPHSVASAAPTLQQPSYPSIPTPSGMRDPCIKAGLAGQRSARSCQNKLQFTMAQKAGNAGMRTAGQDGAHVASLSTGEEVIIWKKGSLRAASPLLLPQPARAAEPLSAARRLEVTLRGTFRTSQPSNEVSDAVENDNMQVGGNPRAASTTCGSEAEEALRARMGFGSQELGAIPSGRSSVPAIHGASHGAISAPPFVTVVDEGIDLDSVGQNAEHHILRVLERSLRGPSRATSCEPQESLQGSPRASPSPSLCPSPTPRGPTEDLSLSISIRLCQTRCGSSSAVLELLLDHCAECSDLCGCSCWPTPAAAEAYILAYFARHSTLRLTSTQAPVRVLLESLNGDEMT